MQVFTVSNEDVVLLLDDLDVEVAGVSAARAHFTLRGQTDAHATGDARGNLHGDVTLGPHSAVAATLVAGIRDGLTGTAARRAGTRGHDLTEERALDGLNFAGTVAGLTADRLGVAVGSGSGAAVAQNGRLDGHVLADSRRTFCEGQLGAKQRVGSGLNATARPTTCAATAAEECFEDVAEAAATESAAEATTAATTGLERVSAEIDDATLLRVGQDLVGRRDLLELGLRRLVRVDVRVQFACQLAVSALELLVCRVLVDAEQSVVIPCHVESLVLLLLLGFPQSSRGGVPTNVDVRHRSERTSPMYLATAATDAIVPG